MEGHGSGRDAGCSEDSLRESGTIPWDERHVRLPCFYLASPRFRSGALAGGL
jgi:hypothetical protein